MTQVLFPKGTEQLKEILEKELGEIVHSIRINTVYDSVFAVKFYNSVIVRYSIDNLEKKYGYRLIRIDMQQAELTFRRVQN